MNRFIVAAVILVSATVPAAAQSEYPNKPIRILVGAPAGGAIDTVARVWSAYAEKELGQPVVVENKPGAGGLLAAETIKRADPDGYNLVMGADSITLYSVFTKGVTFDYAKDLVPVSMVSRAWLVILSSMQFQPKTIREVVAYAKANPGKVNMGMVPNTPSNLDVYRFMELTGTDMTPVPYAGVPPQMQALLSGDLQVTFAAFQTASASIKEGKIRALAVLSTERDAEFPAVPTLREEGVDMVSPFFAAVFAPPGTPQRIVDRLNAVTAEFTRQPGTAERLKPIGMQPVATSPSGLGKELADLYATRRATADRAKIQPQ